MPKKAGDRAAFFDGVFNKRQATNFATGKDEVAPDLAPPAPSAPSAEGEEGPLSGLAAGPANTLKHKPKSASTLKHKSRPVPKGWTVPEDWAVEHRTRKTGEKEVVTAEFHVHAVV